MITLTTVARQVLNLGLATLLAACGVSAVNAQVADCDITIDNAWVRAMPPMQSSTAGYLTVHNSGDSAIEIVAVKSLPLANVEMHNSVEVDGLMTMEHMPSLSVAPGETVAFTPGGKHLMIMDLKKMPAPGETVQLCLQFSNGKQACTSAEVRRAAPPSSDDDESTHQHH